MNTYDVDKIISFLELVHPSMLEKSYTEDCVEIRAFDRCSDSDKIKPFSVNLWRSNNDKKQLVKFLDSIKNKHCCLYYSVFSFKKEKFKKTINSELATSTYVLVADFDNITEEKMMPFYKKLCAIGIESILINSGHGYQVVILLKEKCIDKHILKSFNELLYTKGFPVDLSIQSAAQIMRLPFTYNFKEFDKNNSKYKTDAEKRATFIVRSTEKRYDIDKVFDKINSLEDSKVIVANKEVAAISGDKQYIDLFGENEWNNLPAPIKKMLMRCDKGYRNKSLLTLTFFFKDRGYSLEKTKNITKIWADHTYPSYDADFVANETVRLWRYNFSSINNFYDYQMIERFGALTTTFSPKNKETVLISNKIFKNYDKLKPTTIRIYLYILYAHFVNKETVTKNNIIDNLDISLATLNRHLKVLEKNKLVVAKTSNKKNCQTYNYIPLNERVNLKVGYTLISKSVLHSIFFDKENSLKGNEIKVLLYMFKRMNTSNRTFESQETIGKAVGYCVTTICSLTNSLAKKHYINKQQLLDLIKDKIVLGVLKICDKQLFHYLKTVVEPSFNKWKSNCLYSNSSFLNQINSEFGLLQA